MARYEGQFDFVKEFDTELYTYINAAEKNARLKIDSACNDLRKALERFVKIIMQANGLTEKELEQDPFAQEKKKKDGKVDMSSLWIKTELLKRRNLLPLSNYHDTILCIDGRERKMEAYDMMRKVGNSGSHDEDRGIKPNDAQLTFPNLIAGLGMFHQILLKYFKVKASRFNENVLRIGDYAVYDRPYEPADKARSLCQREYPVRRRIGNINEYEYGIIRQYGVNDIAENFLSRNSDSLSLVNAFSAYGRNTGLIKEVHCLDSKAPTPFRMVVYIFVKKPYLLTEMLDQLDMFQRVTICNDLVDCFAYLHALHPAIYHRLLTYESIYICDYGREEKHDYRPFVKFDFAKIDMGDPSLTVMAYADKAHESLASDGLTKYINNDFWNRSEWEAVDSYALGVLFGDILCGRILPECATEDDLETADVPEVWENIVLDLIEDYQTITEIRKRLEGDYGIDV